MPSASHSFCISGGFRAALVHQGDDTHARSSARIISAGVVAGFTGTAVCLSMTQSNTDMSSGPFGTADADARPRRPHAPALQIRIRDAPDELARSLACVIACGRPRGRSRARWTR